MNKSFQNLRDAGKWLTRRCSMLLFFLVALVTGVVRGVSRLHHEQRISGSRFRLAGLGVVVCLLSLLAGIDAHASHYRYGNISWNRASSSSNVVTLTVTESYRTSAFTGLAVGSTVTPGESLDFGDGSSSSLIVLTVNTLNTAEDYFIGTYTVTHTYAAASNFVATYSSCCRIGGLDNNDQGSFSAQTNVTLATTTTGSPISTLPPVVNLAIGNPNANFYLPAIDPGGSALTYALASGNEFIGAQPVGLSINATTGLVTYSTSGLGLGSLHSGAFSITNTSGANTIVDFLIKIVNTSNPPVFDYAITPANNAVYYVHPNSNLAFTLSASDPDAGGTVLISGAGIPTGATFIHSSSPANPASATFSWTPTISQLGSFVLSFIATDNVGVQTSSNITVNVTAGPDFISPTPDVLPTRFLLTGATLNDMISAKNPNPGVMTKIASASLPVGTTTSPVLPTALAAIATTNISWTPTDADFGENTFSFIAEDANGETGTRSYIVVANTKPVFSSTPLTTASACQPFSYTVIATDVNIPYGDELEFESHTTLPSWLTLVNQPIVPGVSRTAILSGTPSAADVGTYNISLVAADIYHHSSALVEQNFTIAVTAQSVTITNGGNVCSGNSGSFTLTGPAGSVVTYNINNAANTIAILNGAGGTAIIPVNNVTASQTLNLVSITNAAGTCTQALSGSSSFALHAEVAAHAGPDKTICATGDVLQANAGVTPQAGVWSITGGSGTAAGQFASLTDPNTTFTPAVAPGIYNLKWTLSNTPCPSSSDTVVITSIGSVQGTITASSNANVCNGQTSNINISVTPVSGGTFNGTFTNGKTFSGLNPAAGIISPSYTFTNNGITNTTESFVLASLVFHPATGTQPTPTTCAATVQGMGGQTVVTIQPVSDIAAVLNGPVSKCNGSAVTINVTNPNSTGGTYNKTAVYNGVAHSGVTSVSGQSFVTNGTFTETLTNNTNAPLNVVYTFTPVSPGSQGCVGVAQDVTVTVNPTPTVIAPVNQLLCTAAATTAVAFSGAVTGTTYAWTNDNASIGLAASGNGNIASFNAINTGITNAVANIQVVPSANGCAGAAQDFTITVKPTPTVADPADQIVCNGAATTLVTLTGTVSGTTYSWTNDHASTGLAASGNGNLASFTATNSTSAAVISTILVTPLANGCTGAAQDFTITVNPAPSVNTVANDVVCNGAATAAVNFGGAVSGTTYSWTSNNTSIGIAANGTGNIASFNAVNTGTTPVIASIEVTPHANNCTGVAKTYTITVNPIPTVADPADQGVCNGAATTLVSFTGAVNATAFNWTNTATGLATSGSGDIAPFTAINNGTAPAVSTIQVTPVANGCSGTPENFTLTVNPTPVVNAVVNQAVCNGAPVSAVNFGGTVTGTTYSWTNDNTSIGIAAGGTGNIASFSAVNTGTAPVTATIEVTPHANNCAGVARSFTVMVNPTPHVTDPADQVVCNGSATATVNFAGAVSGTSYSWTNDLTSIGLAASGNGNIPSFNVSNTGSADVVAHIEVTPAANGCTGAPETFSFTVHPSPAFNFAVNGTTVAANGTATICQATSTVFAVNGVTPNSAFSMTHNGAAYASGNVNGAGMFSNTFVSGGTASNTTAGTYVLTVTDAVTGCVASRSYTIHVNPKPTDTFKVNGVTLVDGQTSIHCAGETLQLSLAGTASHSFVITKGSNTIASGSVNAPAYSVLSAAAADAGTYTVTLTDDNTGCMATRSYQIVVNPLPVYTFSVNNTALADNATTTHCKGTPVTLHLTGDAGATYTLKLNGNNIASGNVNDPAYTFNAATTDTGTYLLTVMSTAGCVANSSYNMNVNVAPRYNFVPANAAANTAIGSCSATVTYAAATVSGTPAPVLSYTLSGATTGSGIGNGSGSIFNKGVTQVTLTAVNLCGTKDSSFTVTITDNELPVFTSCPPAINAFSAANNCGNMIATTAPVYTDNCTFGSAPLTWAMTGATVATGNGNIGSHQFNVGTTAVAFIVTDTSGNIATCNYNVVVADTIAPAIVCVPNIVHNSDTGVCGASITFNAPAATDNCTMLNTVQTAGLTSGSLFPVGVTTNTFVVTDAAGNTASSSFNVTVQDAQGPVMTAPVAQTLNVGSGNNCQVPMPDYRSLFTIADNCSGVLAVQQLAPNQPGSLVIGYGGTRVIKVKATDIAGNVSVDSFILNLVDATVPVAVCKNIVVNLNAAGTASITASMIDNGSHDNCSAITVSANKLTFDCSDVGAHTVVLTATDASGNSATCNATVTVHDVTAPVVSCWSDTTLLKGPQCTTEIPDLTFRVHATDVCGIASVTQSPAAGTIIAAFTPTVPVTLTVTDVHGNASDCTFNVTFADHTKPGIINFPANIVINNGQDSCGKAVTWPAPVATDNCTILGAAQLTSNHAPGSVFPPGLTTVTYTAVDLAGNDSVRSFTVTVLDAQAPVIAGCPSNILVNTGAAATICGATASWTEPTATDNCTLSGSLVWSKNHNPGDLFPVGTTTVTYTATDASGNVSNACSFNVIVMDNTLPLLAGCPADTTVYTGTGATTCNATATWTEPTATDNCTTPANLVWTRSHTPGSVFAAGTTTVTYTATDASGNVSATCSFHVTVIDNTVPVLSGCPSDVMVNTGASVTPCSTTATWTEPTATDNCTSGANLVWTKSHTSGSVFPIGTTAVTYTAMDAAGNVSAVCSFNVIVTDNTAPVLAGCPATVHVNTGANAVSCTAVATWTEPTATDNCTSGANLVWTKSHTPGSVFPAGTTTVTYTVTDASGNVSATCSFDVVVNDNTAPVFVSCPSSIASAPTNSAGCTGSVVTVNPVVTDNCNLSLLTWTLSGATTGASATTGINYLGTHNFATGMTTVTYTATDASGNSNVCSYTINVVNVMIGNMGGTATVTENSPNTATVTFVATNGGVAPFTFTYSMNNGTTTTNGTVTTSGLNNIVTIPQSNAVLGQYIYTLTGVTDANGCTAQINPANDTAVITVVPFVPVVDLTVTLDFNLISFAPATLSRSFDLLIENIGTVNHTGNVTVILTNPATGLFDYTMDPSSSAFWTLTPGTGNFILTSNGAMPINADGGLQLVKLNLNKSGSVAAGTLPVSAIVVPAPGETHTSNNTSSVNINVSQ